MNNEQHWMTDYLDAFDIQCVAHPECVVCPVKTLREKSPDKTCFRLYCEAKDIERGKTSPSAGQPS